MSDTLPSLQPAQLEPGDILLHMGTGELSKLIAWVGDGLYSHAALVIEGGRLIEAAAAGVRHATLADRTRMTANFRYIDVFRPLRPGLLDTKGIAAVLAAAEVYLGRPYPMTSLVTLGIACAVRNKVPSDPDMRKAIRMALDLVIENDTSKVVCSELVYRGFDEATTRPAHALRLEVIVQPPIRTPLPAIDINALLAECLDDYRRSLPKGKAALTFNAPAGEADVDELLKRARTTLGLGGPRSPSANDYVPNPKTVLPADLEYSPGVKKIGRLALHG
jgi:hypothetical protein